MRYFITILLFTGIILSCEKDDLNTIETKNLFGYWVNEQRNDAVTTYERSNTLKDNDYGFSFNPDNSFIERKNAGWCGTPPISYADFEGSWERNDSIIIISVEYWGGISDYKWKILQLDENHLKIKWLDIQHHAENE